MLRELLTEELKTLAGERYKRNGTPGHVRWTKQWGSVYIGEQKLPIRYQRVRDRRKGKEVELTPYKRLQEPHRLDEGLLKKILIGLKLQALPRVQRGHTRGLLSQPFDGVTAVYTGEHEKAQRVYGTETRCP